MDFGIEKNLQNNSPNLQKYDNKESNLYGYIIWKKFLKNVLHAIDKS